MKIGVLMGGGSSERQVSLSSGKAIVNACKKLEHEVKEFDPKEGFDSLSVEIKKVDLDDLHLRTPLFVPIGKLQPMQPTISFHY